MINPTHSLVPLTTVAKSAMDWYDHNCEPHAGELTQEYATILLTLALGMPEVLEGDGDGACFVVKLEDGKCPQGMAGTSGLCALFVTENLELTIIPIANAEPSFFITPEELIAEYAVVCVNHTLEGHIA